MPLPLKIIYSFLLVVVPIISGIIGYKAETELSMKCPYALLYGLLGFGCSFMLIATLHAIWF